MVNITQASQCEMPLVRALFTEYQQWLGVDLCFQGFEQELAGLPGCYAPPEGAVLLARDDAGVCGCVAFRPLSNTEAELKRLYVKPARHGEGIGRALFNESMKCVQACGYQSVVLDTLPSMIIAQSMYRTYGFVEVPAYYDNPEPGVTYLRYQFAAR
jgi:ribosomal protein S18 acetylase RimI-like enzyme